MAEEWREQLERLLAYMKQRDMNEAWVVKEAGLNVSWFNAARKAKKAPRFDTLQKVAAAVGWSVEEWMGNARPDVPRLKLTGISRGKEMWAEHSPKDARELTLSLLNEDLASIEIDSEDIDGYHVGDVVAGPKFRGPHLDNLIGLECIVETMDGQRSIRFLKKGSREDLFNLRSHDPHEDDIENVKIRWAAPIQLVIRRTH
jgi:hypothetical protein